MVIIITIVIILREGEATESLVQRDIYLNCNITYPSIHVSIPSIRVTDKLRIRFPHGLRSILGSRSLARSLCPTRKSHRAGPASNGISHAHVHAHNI